MIRYLTIFAVCLAWAPSLQAADEEARDKHLRHWEYFLGQWEYQLPDGTDRSLTVRRSTNKACFFFESEDSTAVHGWDPEAAKMRVADFLLGGVHGLGHATLEGEEIRGTTRIVVPDGEPVTTKWSIKKIDDKQFRFSDDRVSITFRKTP